jgi:glutaredoxin 3
MDQSAAAHGDALMSAPVVMYSTRFCPYCVAARRLLSAKNIHFEDIAVDDDPQLRRQMSERAGRRTVPQIWIGETHVGGFTDLAALDRQGELDRLLAGQADRPK